MGFRRIIDRFRNLSDSEKKLRAINRSLHPRLWRVYGVCLAASLLYQAFAYREIHILETLIIALFFGAFGGLWHVAYEQDYIAGEKHWERYLEIRKHLKWKEKQDGKNFSGD